MASLWDRIRTTLRREAGDARELRDDVVERGNASMDRRERELNATPDEKLAIEQERIGEGDAEYEALKKQIEGR